MEASTFPILKIGETVQCLQELSIPVTEADLKDPQVRILGALGEIKGERNENVCLRFVS